MNLQSLLQEPEFSGLSDADALTYGNQTSIGGQPVVVSVDATPYTWSGVGAKLIQNGVSPTDLISFTTNIDTLPGGPLLDKCLSSGGFNFADPLNRATIISFEVSEPAWAVSVLNAMLAIGITTGTFWESKGVAQPILADITAARAAIVDQGKKTLLMINVVNSQKDDDSISYAQFASNIAAFIASNP